MENAVVARNSDNFEPAINVARVGQLLNSVAIFERQPFAIPFAVWLLLHRAKESIASPCAKQHQPAVRIGRQPDQMKRIRFLVDPLPCSDAGFLSTHIGGSNV